MKGIIFGILAVFAMSVTGQEVMTLERAISLALEHNLLLKINETDIQIAENNNTWGRAGKYPTIDLNSTFQSTLINDNNPASFLNGTFFTGGLGIALDVNWQVYNGGRVRVSKDQLEVAITQNRQQRDLTIQNLIRDVTLAYQNVLFQQERYDLLAETLKLSHARLDYEETKRDFGGSNAFNLIQFESAVITDSIALITQENALEVSKRDLYDLLTLPSDQDYVYTALLQVTPTPPNPELLKEELDEQNLTLRSLSVISELQALNTALSESFQKPSIILNTTGGVTENYFKFFGENPQTGETLPGVFSERFNVGLTASLNWNLYDGGVRKTDIQNAKLSEEIAQMDILDATMDLYNQVDILSANYTNQVEQLQLADERLQIAARNLIMAEERLKLGRITSIDFRNIQNQNVAAAFEKVSAIFNLINTQTQLDWLVGRYGSEDEGANLR